LVDQERYAVAKKHVHKGAFVVDRLIFSKDIGMVIETMDLYRRIRIV